MAGSGRHLGRRGITMRGNATVFHSGEAPPPTATTGTDTTPVVTETYFSRVFLPANARITGLALLNGSAVAGNITGYLYDADGAVVASTASTAQSGTAGYQSVALSAPVDAIGPAVYFVGWQFNNTSARFRTHTLGVFTTQKTTGGTYGTAPAMTPAGSFTTGVGPICSTY